MRPCSVFQVGQSTMRDLTTSNYLRGALYGLSAVCIWAAFIVVSRLGVRTSFTPLDVAAIRFGVAGVLLLPYCSRGGWPSTGLAGLVRQLSQPVAARQWCCW